MKPLFSGLFLSLFFCLNSNAQTSQAFNSGEIISKGSALHNEGKYKEAIRLYKQVPRTCSKYSLR